MKFRGVVLILDNLRNVLKGYSIDIQDVVRSAILDGVDISNYIDVCKNNPYKLDQIRLCLKEGIDSSIFSIKSGECIYKIRKLDNSLRNDLIEKLKSESLSYKLVMKLIEWLEKGYDLSNIKISIIPENLYGVFEHGFRQGLDMSIFNNGKSYNSDYIKFCLMILSNGKDIGIFLNELNLSIDCMSVLSRSSKMNNDKWLSLIACVSKIGTTLSVRKLNVLLDCLRNDINISSFYKDDWDYDLISLVLAAYEEGLDYSKLISIGPNKENLNSMISDMRLLKTKKVGGRFKK